VTERLVALLLSLVVALVGLGIVRRRIPLETLQEQHEVAGVAYAVLAALYGVILAFVLVMSWERFESMRHTIELEADALGNLRRHAAAYSPADSAALDQAILHYVESVVKDEWPAMGEGRRSEQTWRLYSELWTTLLGVNPGSDKLNELWQSSLDQMNQMSTARRERMLIAATEIPGLVWAFLVVFGAVTVGFTYFFGMRSFLAHALITAALASTIVSALILILETQTPFQGALNLTPQAFVQLLGRAQADEARLGR
jgi:hypothetical protein